MSSHERKKFYSGAAGLSKRQSWASQNQPEGENVLRTLLSDVERNPLVVNFRKKYLGTWLLRTTKLGFDQAHFDVATHHTFLSLCSLCSSARAGVAEDMVCMLHSIVVKFLGIICSDDTRCRTEEKIPRVPPHSRDEQKTSALGQHVISGQDKLVPLERPCW